MCRRTSVGQKRSASNPSFQSISACVRSSDVLVPGADVAAVTMPVLDRPSERAVQIRHSARKAFLESQGDKAMQRALVARPRPWRDFKVRDQVAFW